MRRYLLSLLLIIATSLEAGWFGADFSADAIQYRPNQAPVSGKMYVGKGRMRSEFRQDNQVLVEIVNPGEQRTLLLLPDRKEYIERPLPELSDNTTSADDPCGNASGMKCEFLGEDDVAGRKAKKWKLTVDGKESLQWHDNQHGFPVRLIDRGTPLFERRFHGYEQLSGRQTEKWEMVQYLPAGKVVTSLHWYDPELNIAVRQVLPGGFVLELHNIRVGAQGDSLFLLPEGYSRVTPAALSPHLR